MDRHDTQRRKKPNPRRTFSVAGQLEAKLGPEGLKALTEALHAVAKPARKRRRRRRKAVVA